MDHSPPPSVNQLELQYLLKELELQVAIEGKARDRVEQMMQYLLAAVAAIIGAAFLIVDDQTSAVLVSFIAALLVLAFGVSAFYRACRLRNAITHARVNRSRIRQALAESGVQSARTLIDLQEVPFESPLNAFYPRIVRNLSALAVFCAAAGGLAFGFGLTLLLAGPGADQVLWAAWLFFPFGFALTLIPLLVILLSYKKAADRLIEKYRGLESSEERRE